MKKINGLLGLISCLVILLLGACSSNVNETDSDQGIVIGFSQLGNESAWRERNTASIQQAAQTAGYQLLFKDGLQKQKNQIKHIRSFIAAQVDVIVLSPIIETGWETVLVEAQEAGIPVVLSDRGIQGDERLYETLVGTDGVAEGRKAGEFLKKKFDQHPGPIKIAEITGTPGSSSSEQRAKGFREVIQQDPRFEIVAVENGDYMLSKGEESMGRLDQTLDLHTINAIFSHNDDMTLGILKYLERTNIKPGKDLVLVSVDAQQEIVDLVQQGVVNCTVECNPNSGPKIMTVINHLLAGGDNQKRYFLEEQVFSEFTDFTDLPPRGY